MLIELTEQYIDAFSSKDIVKISSLLEDFFCLEDPIIKRVEGKQACIDMIQGIFDSCEKITFVAKNIFQQDKTTIIEFELMLDKTALQGVDIIEWENDKMKELRAYLDVPCEDK